MCETRGGGGVKRGGGEEVGRGLMAFYRFRESMQNVSGKHSINSKAITITCQLMRKDVSWFS